MALPSADWYVPEGHTEQFASDVAPSKVRYFPAAQKEQFASEVAPASVEYFPGPHIVQKDPSVLFWNDPAEQRVQLVPAVAANPL